MSQHEKMISHLKIAVANHHVLGVKLQNYHWHVMGCSFKPLHELFGAQYEAMFDAVDLLAERLRALKERAPATLKEFLTLTTLTEGEAHCHAEAMLHDLLASYDQLIAELKTTHQIADDAHDCATTKLLEDLLFDEEKAVWMLRSSLPVKA